MKQPAGGVDIPDMTKHGSVRNGNNSEVGSKTVDVAVREFLCILSFINPSHPTGTEDSLFGLVTRAIVDVELRIS